MRYQSDRGHVLQVHPFSLGFGVHTGNGPRGVELLRGVDEARGGRDLLLELFQVLIEVDVFEVGFGRFVKRFGLQNFDLS